MKGDMATTIPQNELRNQVGDFLRRAEQGERFIITVNGHPTAELGLPGDDIANKAEHLEHAALQRSRGYDSPVTARGF